MRVSSNSLYHFTNNIDVLKKIISESKMSGSYCQEQIIYSENEENIIVVPMICFCDIPIETYVQLEVETYGNYGVGLKKVWGIHNKLNPVLYVDTNSTVAEKLKEAESGILKLGEEIANKSLALRKEGEELENKVIDTLGFTPDKAYNAIDLLDSESLISEFQKENNLYKEKIENEKTLNAVPKLFLHLIEFIKPYQGNLNRGDKVLNDYRYYDEMEWRYVPDRKQLEPLFQIGDTDEFKEWRDQYDSKPLLFSLSFEFKDIDEIVVEKDADVEDFQSFLQEMDETYFSAEQKDGLCSKINSIESLKNVTKTK